MTFNPRSPIWALILAFTYILSAITHVSALPSAIIDSKAPHICYGSQRFSATDLKATNCDVIVGSTWLYGTDIETIVRLDKDHYFISNGEHWLYLNGSVRVDPYGDLDTLEPTSTGRLTLTLHPTETIQHTDSTKSANTTMESHTMIESHTTRKTIMRSSGLPNDVPTSSSTPLIPSTMKHSTADSLVVASYTLVLPTTTHAPSMTLPSSSSTLNTDLLSLTGSDSSSQSKSNTLSGLVTKTQTSTVLIISTVLAGRPPQSNQQSSQGKPLTIVTQTKNLTVEVIPTIIAGKSPQPHPHPS